MISSSNQQIKLHLGCGSKYLPGYIHVDLSDYPHIDYKSEVSNLEFVADSTVTEIYASHVLEYFDYIDTVKVLKEWRRCLVSSGTLKLSVPDFDKLIDVYKLTANNIDKVVGPLFGRWSVDDATTIYHKCVYNRAKLQELILQAGFLEMNDWDPLVDFGISPEDYDDYSKAFFPHMNFRSGFSISLNVVCSN
jgi:predicted SAM-dependent methyltransferase